MTAPPQPKLVFVIGVWRIGDWLAVRCLRSLWNFKRIIFRNVPLKFWVWLREHYRKRLLPQTRARLSAANPDAGRRLTFSIVTPSFRNSEWLKLCIASVADQQGVELEHIVQDSCSDDGTQDWLRNDRRVKA